MFRVDHRLRLLAIGGLIAVAGVLVPAGVASAVVPIPSISFDKTVMIDDGNPTSCGTETALTVSAGTMVRYCYAATNTGDIALTDHTLVDDQIGTVLNGSPFVLTPGETMIYTVTEVVTETVTNTATWTAVPIDFPGSVEAQDSLTVTVTPPSISLEKTVMIDSGNPDDCGTEDALTVGIGTTVRYCYTVTNTGQTPLDLHSLVDDHLGAILTDFAAVLDPGVSISVTATDFVTETVTNTATWTAGNNGLELYGYEATDSATVTAVPPTITLDKTVMIDSGTDECGTETALAVSPGTDVRYCYTVTNTGLTPLTEHSLVDDQLGTLASGLVYTLDPGASTSITQTATITDTVTNVATWTAQNNVLEVYEIEASDDLTVTVIPPTTTTTSTTTTSTPIILPPTGPSSAATNGVLIGLLAIAAGALALLAARRRADI